MSALLYLFLAKLIICSFMIIILIIRLRYHRFLCRQVIPDLLFKKKKVLLVKLIETLLHKHIVSTL